MNQTNTSHISWYRTRKFWGIIYFLAFAFSTIIFIQLLDKDGADYTLTFKQILDAFHVSFGATLFFLTGYNSFSMVGGYLGWLMYWVLMTVLTYKIFSVRRINLMYVLVFTAIYLSGIYSGSLLLSM